jgi:general stress protein 26
MSVHHTDEELLEKVRGAIKGARAVMVGLAGGEPRAFAPMKGHVVEGEAPVWFLCRDTVALARDLHGEPGQAIVNVIGDDHHLYASILGQLSVERDQARIDLFWSSVADAWLPEGRQAPGVVLLRFDPRDLEVWISDNSFALAWAVAKANYKHEQVESGDRASIHVS